MSVCFRKTCRSWAAVGLLTFQFACEPDPLCDGPDAARYRGFLTVSGSKQADSLRASPPDVRVDLYLREVLCGNPPQGEGLVSVLHENPTEMIPALERRFAAPKDERERPLVARTLHYLRMPPPAVR